MVVDENFFSSVVFSFEDQVNIGQMSGLSDIGRDTWHGWCQLEPAGARPTCSWRVALWCRRGNPGNPWKPRAQLSCGGWLPVRLGLVKGPHSHCIAENWHGLWVGMVRHSISMGAKAYIIIAEFPDFVHTSSARLMALAVSGQRLVPQRVSFRKSFW